MDECCVEVEIPPPLVKRPRLLKHAGVDQGLRVGRGYSKDEIRAAGLDLRTARLLGIPIDVNRKSCHEWNVQRLKEFLSKISELLEAKKTKPARLVQQQQQAAS